MTDDDLTPYCLNNHTHGPAIGETTTAVQLIPELADQMGDGGLVENVNLLCAPCLERNHP